MDINGHILCPKKYVHIAYIGERGTSYVVFSIPLQLLSKVLSIMNFVCGSVIKFRKLAQKIAEGISGGKARKPAARASHRARGGEALARHGRVSSLRARWPFPGVRYGLSRGCEPVSRFPPPGKSDSRSAREKPGCPSGKIRLALDAGETWMTLRLR